MALINDRDLRQATEERVVTITAIDLNTKTLVGEDVFGQKIQASLNLGGQIITIPSVGEKWTFARQGNLWYPSKNQQQTLDDLVPGDKKLATDGTLYLVGLEGVVINGYDWNTTLDSINTDIDTALTQAVIKSPDTTSRNTVLAGASGVTPLTLRGHASGTADVLTVTNSANANLMRVAYDGSFYTAGRIFSAGPSTGGIWVDGGSAQFMGSLSATQLGFFNAPIGWGLWLDDAGRLTVPTNGATAGIVIGSDTNLYRNNTNELKTDDTLESALEVYARHGTASNVVMGLVGPSSEPGIRMNDATFYRLAGPIIATSAILQAPTAAVGTNTTQVATTAYYIASAANSVPLVSNSTSAALGSSTRFARQDHVHPLTTQLNTLNAYNSNGIFVQTSAGNFTGRTITGTAGQITVTNGDGVAAGPNIALPATITQGTTFSTTLNVSGIFTAAATGKTAITISDSGAQSSGLTIGGDTNLYRQAANILMSDDIIGTTVGGRHAYIGGAYTVDNEWIGGYFAGSLRWDGTNWQNETAGGNNGYAMFATDGASGGFDFYTEASTGASNRTLSPATLITKKVLSVLADGKMGILQPAPTRKLSFANDIAEKISLYAQSATARDFYGFGIEGGTLQYQVPSGGQHLFYVGASTPFVVGSDLSVKSNGMRVHRHPYANERHVESGTFGFSNANNDTGYAAGVTFTDAYASTPNVVGNLSSVVQGIGDAYRTANGFTDDPSTTGFTAWWFGSSSGVASFDGTFSWFADGAD